MAFVVKKDTSFKMWFEIPGSDGARVELCTKSDGEMAISMEAMIAKAAVGTPVEAEIERRYVDAITSWEGIEDENGKELKLTIANKQAFLRQPTIIDFMRESLAELNKKAGEEHEKAQKN